MRGDVSVVEEHVILGGLELLIMAKHVLQEPVLHDVFVIGGDARGSHIRQEFIKYEQGTKILVDVDLKLKGRQRILGMLGANNFRDSYLKIIDDFARIAKKD